MGHLLELVYGALTTAANLWCHQRPERSPVIWGVQFFLCWRCTGIAAGAIVLLVYLGVRRKLPPFGASLLLALGLPLDVLLGARGDDEAVNFRRLATGVLWGIYGTSLGLYLLRFITARLSFPSTPAGGRKQDRAAPFSHS